MAVANPVVTRELRTANTGTIDLVGIETVNWLNLHVFSFGNWVDNDRDGVVLHLESSIDGTNWMNLAYLGAFTGTGSVALRSILGHNVLTHLPPFLRIRWEKINEVGRENLPFEVLVLVHSGN